MMRIRALTTKEFLKIFNDYFTVILLIGIPFVQILLFGYAINTNPKHLPTVVIDYDKSEFSRRLIKGLENTQYFSIYANDVNEEEAHRLMQEGKILFILHINSDFARKMIRNERPQVLLDADYTDFVSVGAAVSAAEGIVTRLYPREREGLFNYWGSYSSPFTLNVHRVYNPRLDTTYNIIPGLICVIIFLSLAVLASHTITDEKITGTYETLLNSPVTPLELMSGKILPYVLVGYIQLSIIIFFSWWLFNLPVHANIIIFYLAALPFILASLVYGFFCSVISPSSTIAQQLVILLYLPSILLSGFMFPFYGLPKFAQHLGNLLPTTHFIRTSKGIFIKHYTAADVWVHVWPIMIFLMIFTVLAIIFFRKTLD